MSKLSNIEISGSLLTSGLGTVYLHLTTHLGIVLNKLIINTTNRSNRIICIMHFAMITTTDLGHIASAVSHIALYALVRLRARTMMARNAWNHDVDEQI